VIITCSILRMITCCSYRWNILHWKSCGKWINSVMLIILIVIYPSNTTRQLCSMKYCWSIINIRLSVDVETTRNVDLQDCRWVQKPHDILNCEIIGG